MKRKLVFILAFTVLGCDDAVDTGAMCVDNAAIVQELPDHNAELSIDVDVYIASKPHAESWTYTLPHVESHAAITVSKILGYCDPKNAMRFVGEQDQVLVDIFAETPIHGCRGWARLMTVGDDYSWRMTEFGGDVSW
jgi:hypothetical protein